MSLAARDDDPGFSRIVELLHQEVKVEIQRDIRALEERLTYKLTLRMGTMLAASVAVITALVKLV